MGLFKKKSKPADLKADAEQLWQQQREVLGQANKLIGLAGKQIADYSKSEVLPRISAATSGASDLGRSVAHSAKDVVINKVIPAVTGVAASAMAMAEVAKNKGFRKAVVQPVVPPKKKGGFGKFISIGLTVAAVAAAATFAYKFLVADDELWIEESDTDD